MPWRGEFALPARVVAALSTAAVVLVAGALAADRGPGQKAGDAPAPRADVHTWLRTLDEAASRGLWPDFKPAAVPLALFDGEHTILRAHPSPPPEFSAVPEVPGLLVARGRHPSVVGNTTRDLAGVRTATVMAQVGATASQTMLALAEEVFHVFWLPRHPVFRPNEMARYGYPLDAVDNHRAILAEDEALARAVEAASAADAARWAAAALEIRRGRLPALPDDVRAFETAIEMMEGTANYVARIAAGEGPAQTAERLRRRRPTDGIRWRFYDSGAALCFALDRLSPAWKSGAEREPALTTVDQLDAALRAGAVPPAAFTAAELAGFGSTASADVADLVNRRDELRSALLSRSGPRLIVDLAPGTEPLRVRRFDPINLMVLAAGEVAHPHNLSVESPHGTIELDNPGYVRGSYDGTVGLTAPAGRHPFGGGMRQLTIVGLAGEPVVAEESGAVSIDAPGVRVRVLGALTREAGGALRITVGRTP